MKLFDDLKKKFERLVCRYTSSGTPFVSKRKHDKMRMSKEDILRTCERFAEQNNHKDDVNMLTSEFKNVLTALVKEYDGTIEADGDGLLFDLTIMDLCDKSILKLNSVCCRYIRDFKTMESNMQQFYRTRLIRWMLAIRDAQLNL